MCEVLKSNFDQLYSKIEKSIKTAALIAIDSEFSGLSSNSSSKRSLFDSPAEHYSKLKQGIDKFIILQFGLSAFHYNRDLNQYSADVYNFYIIPHSFASVDNQFLCQTSSLEFLCKYHFNFNKVMYDGIAYLNLQQESELRSELFNRSLMSNLERAVSMDDEKIIQVECSKILEWSLKAEVGESMFIDLKGIDFRLEYLLQKDIRSKINTVWTYSEISQLRIEKLDEKSLLELRSKEGTQLEDTVLNNLIGFSKIFKLLVALKKPIIGHNFLLDMMIMYNQFHEPLPNSYAVFKKNVHILFPCVYDTKVISYEVKRSLDLKKAWSTNSLVELYTYFKDGTPLVPHSPQIVLVDSAPELSNSIQRRVHEACWDAYMTGFCFIHLAHYKAVQNLGKNAIARPLSRVEHFTGVEPYRNCLNVVRCTISFINISGNDPPSSRPEVLYARRRDRREINVVKLTGALASFGSLDVIAHSDGGALIAAANSRTAKDILREFKNNDELFIAPYFAPSHSLLVKTALWTGLTVSTALCLTYIILTLRSIKQ